MIPRWCAVALLLAACTGEVESLGVGEPIRVHGATLRRSELPGGAGAEGPRVTAIDSTGGIWQRGQLDRTLAGRVSEETFAVGLSLAGMGTGWWTFPAGSLDPAFPGERTGAGALDVGGGLPPGVHTLRAVAIDEQGRGGAWTEIGVCVTDPSVPDNLSACDPTLPPPDAVIVLRWDADADLDLVVETPEGKIVDERHPTTAYAGEGGRIPPELLRDPSVGRLDGDSLAECEPDGRNSESLTWQAPAHVSGNYNVHANLFDACGHGSVRFTVSVYRRLQTSDTEARLEEVATHSGFLLGLAANGGSGPPLYVTTVTLP